MDLIKTILPWLGAALTGPVGLATMAASKIAGSLGLPDSTVDKVKEVLSGMSPEALQGMKKLDLDFQKDMKALGYKHEEQLIQFDLDQIKTVNQTIQIELQNSANETWYQKGWRPANGFSIALGSFAGVLAVCYLGYQAITTKDPSALNMIPALASGIAMILAVPGAAVGIAAWHRGMAQREQIEADSNGKDK